MKIIHISDTHLWLSLENTTREDDFYNNFTKVIDEIILQKADLVIHSWDLFHSAKPSNKAISIVIENFLKLQNAQIKVVIIAWNHDTPRLSITTHPFEIFKSFEWFYSFYEPKIDNIVINDINFVVLPHIHDENIFKEEFSKSQNLIKEDKKNIFISHFWLSAKDYDEYTDEISWVNISMEELNILKKFDYVALGHYHKKFCIWNICYAWSLEHTSFNQKNYINWYNILNIWEKIEKTTTQIETRAMIDFWNIDCANFENTESLIEYLENNIDKKTISNAIIKILFENINSKLMLEFQDKLIYDFFKESFYFEFRKIKLEKIQNNWFNVKSWKNIIIENFWNFMNNYNFENEEIKTKLQTELQNELKNIS